jgi:TatD DNase family protein
MWIDTHAHLDAPELLARGNVGVDEPAAGTPKATAGQAVQQAARAVGVGLSVIPAVAAFNFDAVRQLAHAQGDAYALGLHPLYLQDRTEPQVAADLALLDEHLTRHRDDPRLVAVGEIGLDFFVPALCTPAMRQRQAQVYRAQLKLARRHGLPVLLHVRRSADELLKHLRDVWRNAPGGQPAPGQAGIAHAFNGSDVQAQAFVSLGFKLGFGGTVTFDTSRQIRRLAAELPATVPVMETDAPDIPPQWLYATAAQRQAGQPQGVNTPAELPRIGAVVAGLRGVPVADWAAQTTTNAVAALPRLGALLKGANVSDPLTEGPGA